MSEIKRYEPMSYGIESAFLAEDPQGDAVKYDDHYYALAAKDAEIELLSAQREWMKDRLSDLQLPAKSPKNIEEWLAECGMPTALKQEAPNA